MAAAMYAPEHPLHHLVIGSHEHIAANTLDDIAGFYRTWYVPANAHLVLAGAVEVGEARRLVDRYFGSFPSSRPPARRAASAADGARPDAMTQRLPDRFATMERLHFAWRGPAAHGAEGTALEVLAAAWAAPGTGALWKRLVYREQLAQRVSTWMVNHRLGSEFHVAIDLRSGIAAERVEHAFDEELAAACGAPFDAAAISRVVGRREAGVLWGLQSIAKRAADLQRHLLWHGEPNGFASEAARFRAVEPGAVQRAAAFWLTGAHRLTIHTEPRAESSGRSGYPRARTVDRSTESESDESGAGGAGGASSPALLIPPESAVAGS
jgi:zinc protease